MRKKDFIYGTIILTFVLLIVILFIRRENKELATDIFNNSAESIVEVKAASENVGESFESSRSVIKI